MGYFDGFSGRRGAIWETERSCFSDSNGGDNGKIQRETGIVVSSAKHSGKRKEKASAADRVLCRAPMLGRRHRVNAHEGFGVQGIEEEGCGVLMRDG